ncbi:MAG TPA: isoprenylcysteine carboxylmethyltransferase family protein [Dongiaceae bacterium]|jgi:protein-S-isoprenylcysteine O-methyltransferase Ste14|nr:isoprenylcysteine carboxylmethyltransferase family protein [Dongiaceae bacterium]
MRLVVEQDNAAPAGPAVAPDAAGAARNSPAPCARPRSASGAWTGAAGVVAALGSAFLLRDWAQAGTIKTLAVLLITAGAMIGVDLLVYRVHRNAGREMTRQPKRGLDLLRVGQKLVGFWLTIGIIAALYALIPEYQDAFYAPFKDAARMLLPALLVASPFYIAYVDRRQDDPADAYAQIAELLGGRRPADWGPLRTHARGWLVKAFFTPLMFVYANNDLAALWSSQTTLLDFRHVYERLYDLFFMLDVLLAVVTYTLTLRILDNHVRSVEPTIGGWIICVICYRPLVDAQAPYIRYELDDVYWGNVFSPHPLLYVLWGSAILFLIAVYVWSTAAFGLRFSNLTHRGIITHGPYRWVKHPAYLAKNLSWWMISVPFVAGAGWEIAMQSCLMLGAANLIYYLRAKTEERHLAADPVYRDYQDYIARHGLFARLFGSLHKDGPVRPGTRDG